MAKGYWIAFYHSVKNPDAVAQYSKLAVPAILAAGGRFIARGMPLAVYEGASVNQRVVAIEFDSVQQAVDAHDGPGYQEALKVLGDAVVRDMRIIEGVA